jgi:hypothetical protein
MKTRRYDLTSALAALILFFGVAAVNPVLAQDFGDAGFNTTAKVNSSGAANANRLGATGDVDDGVTQLAAFMEGGTAYFTVNASVIGNLHVWIDSDNDADFTDQTRQDFVMAAGNNHVAVALGATTPGTRWFRFIFEGGTNNITGANTDQSATGLNNANGEIEDYQFTVIPSGGVVTFATTAGGVTTTIERNGSDVEVSDGTKTIFRAPVANILTLTIDGDNAADDSFVVDLTNGDPIPLGGLTVNGQGQAASDVLTITDGTNNASVIHSFMNANDGLVVVDDGTISYTGLEPITDNVPAVLRVFTFNANAEAIVVDDDGGAGNNIGTIDSDFGEIVTFDVSATTNITINAGAGDDVITIRELDSAYAGTFTVNGQSDSDELVVDFSSGDPIPGAGTGITYDGDTTGTDTDKLTLSGGGVFTTVTHTGTGQQSGTANISTQGTVSYSEVEANVEDNLDATTKVFEGAGTADTATLGDGAGSGDLIGKYDSQNSPAIEFSVANTDNIIVNLNGGGDQITVERIDSAWGTGTDNIVINGGLGNDEMIVDFKSPTVDAIPGSATGITFNGDGGNDNVQFNGAGNFDSVVHTGTTTSSGSSEFFVAGPTTLGTVAYNSVENPTEDTLTDVDNREFTLTNAGDTVTLDNNGNGANNTARYQSDTQPTVLFNITGTANVTVTGGSLDDSITIKELSDTFAGSIDALPNAGNDTLVLTFDPGDDPIPAAGLTYDGGVGDSDTIVLNGTASQTTVTYVDTGAEAGTITNNSGTLTYSNVEGGITDSTPATTRTFDFSQVGLSTLEFDDETGAGDTTDKMVSDVGQDIVYRSPATTLNIFAGSDDNLVIINDLDNNFTGTINVNGEGGDDRLDLDWENNADSPLGGIVTITYDGGAQTAGDDLRLLNGTPSYVTHSYSNASSGSVEVGAATDGMTYTDIEPIYDFLDVATRTFNFPNADAVGVDDIIYLDADDYLSAHDPSLNNFIGTAGSTEGDSNTSEETHFYSDATLTSVTINGGTGDDYFDIEPSSVYTITTNGDDPSTFTLVEPGDQITLNVAGLPADEKITLTEGSNTSGTYSFSKQGGGASIYKDVSYTTMELVTLRFSDPNAFSGSTYEGDWTYPVNTESGISIEPYFNWDIEINQALPALHPSKYTSLRLDVSRNLDLSSPVFRTTTKEDGVTLLINSAADEDHYIMDADRDDPAPDAENFDDLLLLNNTQYYWGLTATMTGGQQFCQVSRFTTVNNLIPTLDYPSEDLTIYDLDFQFDWNVASPAQPDVYWRMELDNTTAAAFVGDVPETAQGLLMGEGENDDDTTVADGFADETEFQSSDLPTPLVWGTDYAWRVSTMWPAPPTGWVPQEIFDKNETDRLVNMSAVGEFKTVTKALVPNLTYPVGGLNIYANDPILSWNVAAPFAALTFELEIRSGSDVGPLVCASPIVGISGLQYDAADCAVALVPGTTYFWKVSSTDGNSTSAWSAWESFTILGNGVASEAFPSYPVDDLEIYTTSPEFHWFLAKDPTGLTWVAYYLERTGPAPASCAALKVAPGAVLAPAAGNVSVTHVDVSGLKPGATYDWCVATTGANGTVDSDVASFSVAGGTIDGAPTATWPIGNPTTYTLNQELHWSVVGAQLGISSYTVEYCINAPFGSGGPACTTVTGITQRQYEVTGLDYGDVVLWRVKASYINGASDSAWSNGGFTVTGALNTLSAVLTYPVGGLVIYDDAAQFSWYVNGATLPQGALTFRVQWSYAESFPTIGNITQTATTTNPYLDVTSLIPGHTYWWRVQISLDGGSTYGGWSSPIGSFEVHPGAGAVMPRVGSPAQSVVIATDSPMLSWILPTQSESVLIYEVLIGQQENLSDAVVYSDIPQTSLRVTGLGSGQFFWAVRSYSADGSTSALSSVGTFFTSGSFSTGVETEDHSGDDNHSGDRPTDDNVVDNNDTTGDDVSRDQDSTSDGNQSVVDPSEEVLPDVWALGQNYPNPFNPTTTIEFSMPQAAGVTVRVYNVLGQVVKTLVNGTLPPGIHRVQWDATDDTGAGVTSGLYIYRMETEAFQATKTLVLMK